MKRKFKETLEHFDIDEMLGYLTFKRAEGIDYDHDFENELFTKLKNMDKNSSVNIRTYYPWLRFGMLMASLLVILFAATTYINQSNKPNIITVAEAKELVRKKVELMLKENTIYHQKTIYTAYDENGEHPATSTSELWEDQNSSMSKNITTYLDNISVLVDDGKTLWIYNKNENTLYKQPSLPKSKGKIGYEIDLIKKFKLLVENNQVEAKFTERDGQHLIEISEKNVIDINNLPTTKITKYYFDKNNFKLVRIDMYRISNDDTKKEIIESDMQYLSWDIYERNNDNIKKYFVFDYPIPDNVTINEKATYASFTFEFTPSLLDFTSKPVGTEKSVININATNIDVNPIKITLAVYKKLNGAMNLENKYMLSDIEGKYMDESKKSVLISASIPSNILSGSYFFRIYNSDGSVVNSRSPIQIISNSNNNSEWKKYSTEIFSLDYPGTWDIDKNLTSGRIEIYDPYTIALEIDDTLVPTKYINISVIETDTTPQQYVNKITSNPAYTNADVNRKPIVLNGYLGEIYKEYGVESQGYDVVISNTKALVIINFPYENPYSDLIIGKIFSTFTFKNNINQIQSYVNKQQEIVFNYPSNFSIDAKYFGFIPPYDLEEVLVILHKDGLKDTVSQYSQVANFAVSRSQNISSCYIMDNEQLTNTKSIGGRTYYYGKVRGAATGHSISGTVYRTIKDNYCYEVQTSIQTETGNGSDMIITADQITQDQNQMQSELDYILSTFNLALPS